MHKIYCPNCGHANRLGTQFCPYCGYALGNVSRQGNVNQSRPNDYRQVPPRPNHRPSIPNPNYQGYSPESQYQSYDPYSKNPYQNQYEQNPYYANQNYQQPYYSPHQSYQGYSPYYQNPYYGSSPVKPGKRHHGFLTLLVIILISALVFAGVYTYSNHSVPFGTAPIETMLR